jgi:hypothetical protein
MYRALFRDPTSGAWNHGSHVDCVRGETIMNKNEKSPKLRIRTGAKAGDGGAGGGGPTLNHSLRVRTGAKAGNGPVLQHGVRVRQ